MTGGRKRLDLALVERGLSPTRARARDAILRGHVAVNGEVAKRPSLGVASDADLSVTDPAQAYVSRAALKLIAGLEAFSFDPAGAHALDIGASTGGFTQVLLKRGAASVTAIDVGHGQLAPTLADDARVTSIEGLNARDLTAEHLAKPPTFLVADTSFISLKLALGPALDLAASGARGVFLVKPQFEVGREALGKGGIVRDADAAQVAADDVAAWVSDREDWSVEGLIPSPITGGDGNREFLLGARKGGRAG